MFIFFYHFLWTVGLIFCLPIIWLLRGEHSANRVGLGYVERASERFALRLPEALPAKGNIWIHALSVGEVVSAIPLVNRLRVKFPDKDIVFTVTTVTGMTIAREKLDGKVKTILTMPVDAWWSVQRMVDFVKPSVFILIETDIWPALLYSLKRKGVRSILVNGRISPRTFRAYTKAPFLVRKMFEPIDLCLMQSNLDRERLLQVGLNEEKVITVGNIKFDQDTAFMSDEERRNWFDILAMDFAAPLWIAGSTHPGEEVILLEVFEKLRGSFPLLLLILAPRDVERSDEIVKMIEDRGLRAALRTEIAEQIVKANTTNSTPSVNRNLYDVLVLNTIGELVNVYGLGRVSFVGGSLVPIGGHNLLEPAGSGSPVLFGPHTSNFVSMSKALLEAGGGWQVRDGSELHEAMKDLLEDAEMRARMGDLAKAFVENNRGALKRVVDYVRGNMSDA